MKKKTEHYSVIEGYCEFIQIACMFHRDGDNKHAIPPQVTLLKSL